MITSLTRRELRDLITKTWHGRLTPTEFLQRIYDLDALPSKDDRWQTYREDIEQHAERHEDWVPGWIFLDERLQLDDDDKLLRLLAETQHPEVVEGRTYDARLVAEINELLVADGFELFIAGSMSGRPIFSWRRTIARKAPIGEFPTSLIAGMSQIIPELTTSTGIDSMFEAEDFPKPIDPAPNKEEKVKSWLRAAQADKTFDHWAGLGRVLAPVMEPAEDGTHRADYQRRIREVLAKRSVTYLPGGVFTTAPPTSVDGLPATTLMPSARWTRIGSGGFGTVYRAPDPRLGSSSR